MIEVLEFLARQTRPDIATAVEILSQYSNRPTIIVIQAAKNVFGYLKKYNTIKTHHHSTTFLWSKASFCELDFAADM